MVANFTRPEIFIRPCLRQSGSQKQHRRQKYPQGESFCDCMAQSSKERYRTGWFPGGYDKGFPIEGTGEAEDMGAIVYHCGTGRMENRLITAGGRVLAVTGVTDNLKTSIEKAYIAASKIHFENKFNRTDIGSRALSRL